MKIVLITERRVVTPRLLAIAQNDIWPQAQVLAIETISPLGRFDYDYPAALADHHVPFVGAPLWRPRPGMPWPRYLDAHGAVAAWHEDADTVLRSADEIVFAADPDPRGAMAFHVLLTEVLGADAANRTYRAPLLTALDMDSLREAFLKPTTTAAAVFQAALRAGQARRFFDFSYNVNAFRMFNRALHQAGWKAVDRIAISKYGLQLLYYVARSGAMRDTELLRTMQAWPGTGKYQSPTSLGSPSSQPAILMDLQKSGLLQRTPSNAWELSTVAHRFLALLHKDCEDPDLPYRLRAWEERWPDSRTQVVRYLRSYFGKLHRHLT